MGAEHHQILLSKKKFAIGNLHFYGHIGQIGHIFMSYTLYINTRQQDISQKREVVCVI